MGDGSVGMVKSDINKAKWQVRDKHLIYTNELIRNQVWYQVWYQVWDHIRIHVRYQAEDDLKW